jgi:FKBP-type peptidyl-prolyl cis-trans isomerase 2
MRWKLLSALWLAGLLLPLPGRAEEEGAAVVAPGHRVSIEYTLSLADGSVVDGNVGQAPLAYEHGGGQILPALESALVGLAVGASKQVTLAPEQAYGEVDPALFQEVDAERIPADAREAGVELAAEAEDGSRRLVRVHEVKGDRIVVDMNHPLAGKTLRFDVKIVAID